ncbi:MAG: protealysin inhibitor emfourin [Acidobacteriota bacterium]
MKIRLKTSGGIGGLQIEHELDTADLPPELAQRAEEHLSSESLRSIAASRSLPGPSMIPADGQQYEIHLLPEASDPEGEVERHVVDDFCPKGEILDVIDDLKAEIRRRSEAG